MKPYVLTVLLAVTALPAHGESIKRACLSADRKADYRLCTCIQNAADRTLTARDQRLAASFFRDPDRAQEIRQSDRHSHEVFWKRYRAFSDFAEAICS